LRRSSVDQNIRQQGSFSRRVADTLQQAWSEHNPGGAVVRRDLIADPLPADAWATGAAVRGLPAEQRTAEQAAASALAASLAGEVLGASTVVVATALYNFGITLHRKNWIDLLILDPRFSPGSTPLAGRPLTLVVARGGGYGPGTPREGWDHATPYLRRIFGEVFGADVTLVEAELTLAGSVPAMADLRGVAAESLAKAHELAAVTGKAHAALVGASV
jgi:FMN-dependent NADH-azoreductase